MMNTRIAIICLTLAFFFLEAHGATVTFNNKCSYTVWPGTQADNTKPQLSKTGFELQSGDSNSIDVPGSWSGHFWARTGCPTNSGKFFCETGDCSTGQLACSGEGGAPPLTNAELQLAPNGGLDYYDVDVGGSGFNVPTSIAPQGGTGDCKAASCPANINAECPPQLQPKGSDGKVVACKSACLAFNDPKYCCSGASGQKCPATEYSQFLKKRCPQAFSYPNDNQSTFTCSNGPNYGVTFCP